MNCSECDQYLTTDEAIVIGRNEVLCMECALEHTDLYFPDYRIQRHLRGF